MFSLRRNTIYLTKARYLTLSVHDCNSQIGIPFAKPHGGSFVQDAPHLENSFEGDAFLRRNLQRILPAEVSNLKKNCIWFLNFYFIIFCILLSKVYVGVQEEFSQFGVSLATDIYKYSFYLCNTCKLLLYLIISCKQHLSADWEENVN